MAVINSSLKSLQTPKQKTASCIRQPMLDNGTFGTRQHTADRWRDCDGDWYADLAMLMDPTFGGSDGDGCHPFGAALWQWQ